MTKQSLWHLGKASSNFTNFHRCSRYIELECFVTAGARFVGIYMYSYGVVVRYDGCKYIYMQPSRPHVDREAVYLYLYAVF